jgi:transcriptional regulator with XRE-family HTH domain
MFVNKEAVGKRILQIRKKYGYSMQKFGEIIDNAPKGSVNSWEKGVNLPNEKRLKQIATLGNMTLNELLYGSFKEYVDMLITEKLGIELPEEAVYAPYVQRGNFPVLVDRISCKGIRVVTGKGNV